MAAKRHESPWLTISESFGSKVWRTPEGLQFACDDFWRDFDWNRPKPGQQMKLVFVGSQVKGAEKLLCVGDCHTRCFKLNNGHILGVLMELEKLLLGMKNRDIEEFYVWWWPEYRDAE